MYTLDTNAIIYFLKDDAKAKEVLRDIFIKNVPIYISTITEIELFSFPGLDDLEKLQLERRLSTLSIISLDSPIARIASFLKRMHNLKLADSIIAATALFTGSTLVTRNVRDFAKVPNLSIKKI